ncbi:hypothetical protein LIER_27629 [Lithospermum erythrorhizon]|uniref:Uncharacterized protein n=1 Tax=Lithospermum erythrorhizon TaxID=34254 RepID=A0AAV3RGB4_LITER
MASNQQFNAGQIRGQSQAKTEQWAESAKGTAHSAVNKAENAAQRTQQKAQQHESGGVMQQTGEKVAHMAQGAVDGVKNTLGIGEQRK